MTKEKRKMKTGEWVAGALAGWTVILAGYLGWVIGQWVR